MQVRPASENLFYFLKFKYTSAGSLSILVFTCDVLHDLIPFVKF